MAVSERRALVIGLSMGMIVGFTLMIPLLVFVGRLSMEFADLLLRVFLILVTASYTFATYGQWWDE